MSVLSPSKLETHEIGTSGGNAIINGNWEQLNKVLDPALAEGGNPDEYHLLINALVKDATPNLVDNDVLLYDATGKKLTRRAQMSAVADATGAGDVVAQLNALLAELRTRGDLAP